MLLWSSWNVEAWRIQFDFTLKLFGSLKLFCGPIGMWRNRSALAVSLIPAQALLVTYLELICAAIFKFYFQFLLIYYRFVLQSSAFLFLLIATI